MYRQINSRSRPQRPWGAVSSWSLAQDISGRRVANEPPDGLQ